jgi:NADPH-dependent 2,4-dienoyl-CoA reductase/sulfur reductase-like enzyme
VTRENGTVVVVTDTGDRIEADEILFATGRRPRTADIGLDTVGLEPGGWLARASCRARLARLRGDISAPVVWMPWPAVAAAVRRAVPLRG